MTEIETTDFKKQLKALYQPTHKHFTIIEVPRATFVMIDGEGAPGSEMHQRAIQWLFSTIYPIKFDAKKRLGKTFVAPPLEGLWWADDYDSYRKGRRAEWKWRMMIVLPDWISDEMFEDAVAKAERKLGPRPASLRMEAFEEGLSVQIMHIGPFADEAPVIEEMHSKFIPENGLIETGYHHEIYLNDFRRTAPEKLRTVLRQPVRRKV